ncbi:MAG: hypothetical protein RIS17_775 [Pseudomonadota bacterium]|jgi:phage shock protein PspC (stress-responsive transcriptional regulator)
MSRQFLIPKSQGKLMGVCAGVANYFGFDVTLVRIAFALGALISFGTAVLAYIIIGVLAPSTH